MLGFNFDNFLSTGGIQMITNMIKPYAAKLKNAEYLKLRKIVKETIEHEDKKRGL